jgi:hypothetical protein
MRRSVKPISNYLLTYANNALRADQLDELVGGRSLAIALSIGLEVAKVPNMADLISRSTVCLAVWVDCSIIYKPGFKYI